MRDALFPAAESGKRDKKTFFSQWEKIIKGIEF